MPVMLFQVRQPQPRPPRCVVYGWTPANLFRLFCSFPYVIPDCDPDCILYLPSRLALANPRATPKMDPTSWESA